MVREQFYKEAEAKNSDFDADVLLFSEEKLYKKIITTGKKKRMGKIICDICDIVRY